MNDLQTDTIESTTTSELPALSLFASVAPVSGYDAGINLHTLSTDERGVLATVPPFTNVRGGDELRVYMDADSMPVVAPLVLEGYDLGRALLLHLPAERFTPGAHTVHYRFSRNNIEYGTSRDLSVLVKLDRPGGSEPGHQGLVAADVGVNPVTAEHLENGVQVQVYFYEHRAVGDVIRLSWGGVMLSYTLVETDLNQPVVFTVPGSVIRQAGDSPNLVVTWEVHDIVHNTSQTWAPHVSVVVDTGHAQLPAVSVPGLDHEGYINLEVLGSDDLLIQVQASAPAFAIGDTVRLRFTGYIDSGLPTHIDLDQTLRGTLPQTLTFTIANDKAWALASGLAVVGYRLVKAGGEQHSQRLSIGFKGQPKALTVPRVAQAEEGVLAYDIARAAVMIPHYQGRTAGHQITLVWQGTQLDGRPTLHEVRRVVTASEGAGDREVAINVGTEHIRLLESGTLKVYYQVRMLSTRSVGFRQSDPLELRISAAGLLPAPEVDEPVNELDPHLYPLGVQVTVNYPGKHVGDKVTFTWQGAGPESSYSEAKTVDSSGALPAFRVPQAIANAGLGSTVLMRYEVEPALGGRPLPSQERALALRSVAPVPELAQLLGMQDGSYDPMLGLHGAQVLISYPGMRASDRIVLYWKGAAGAGSPVLPERPGSDTGSLTISVPAAAVAANFNGAVQFYYEVLRNELAALESPRQTVQIGAPSADDLPRPRIDEANGSELDLDLFEGNAHISVSAWPFIALGQRLWLEVRSANATLPLLVDSPVEQVSGLTVALPREFLDELDDGSALSLHLRVNFGGAATLDFPVRTYTVRQGQLHIGVSDSGLASSALPEDWALPTQTCAVNLVGRPGAQGSLSVNGSAQFDNDSQQLDFILDAKGEYIAWLGDPYAETVLVSAVIGTGQAQHVPVRFTDVFPYDQQQDDRRVRARAASGALANGRAANRVCFDADGFANATYVQVELSGSARIVGHPGQVVSLPLTELTGDCQFDVVDNVAEEVTLTFQLPQGGSWTRFSKTLYFSSLASRYAARGVAADGIPWFMRVNQITSVETSHVRIPHMREFSDHPGGLDGGIGVRAMDADKKGLLVLVEPYLQMAAGDKIHVHFGDEEVPATPLPIVVLPNEVNELVTLFVPAARIPKGVSEVWFTVEPLSGNKRASARLRVKVKVTLPGGPNPIPGSPHHAGLMSPDVPFGLIDWEMAQDGITVYVNRWRVMEVGDTLNLSWGGAKVTHVVQEGEVGKTIPVFVDYATIEAGGDDERLLVLYWLEDEVGNESDGASLPSYAFVEVSLLLLPRPGVAGIDEEGFLDLGALQGADVEISVIADRPDFRVGDQVVFTFRGYTEDVAAIPPHVSPAYPVGIIPPPRTITHKVPNSIAESIAGGLAYVSYKVTRDGQQIPSRTTAVGVRGKAAELVPPDVDERQEDFLPDTLPRAVVRIPPWVGMFAGQQVRLVWQGKRENGHAYAFMRDWYLTGSQVDNPVVLIVDAEHIAALSGGNLELFYRVYFGSSEPRESQVLPLWVGEPAPELVAPNVPEAENDTLDPIGIVVATVEAPLYEGMAPGQTVWMEWLSPVAGADIIDNFPVQTADDVAFPVYEEDIVPSLGHEVRIRYYVSEPAERRRYSDFLHLGIGPVLSNPPRPRIEEANGDVLDLRSFQGNALATVAKWNGINERQRYWFRCRGTDAQGNAKTIVLAEGQRVSAGEVNLGVRATLNRADLQAFAHQSRITLEMAVALREDAEESQAIRFPVREYQILQVQISLTDPKILEARGQVLELAAFSGNATLRIDRWQGIVAGQQVWVTLEGKLQSGGDWTLPLLVAHPVSPAEVTGGITRPISRSDLEKLSDRSRLNIHLRVENIEAPVIAYEMRVRSTAALAVSNGGYTRNMVPFVYEKGPESNGVTVLGTPGQRVTLRVNPPAGFVGGAIQKDVTLDGYGEWHEKVGIHGATSTTFTAVPHGGVAVTAQLHFRDKMPPDISNSYLQASGGSANGARADGRSSNRVFFSKFAYPNRPDTHRRFVTVTVSGGARIIGHPGSTVVMPLYQTGTGTGQYGLCCEFDVTHTRAEEVVITFGVFDGVWGSFSKIMRFT
ncbi:hypothetical protein [Pseudomonas donghuensis]|uniref:hypothetical protein n=1 Tax=Pseudomonas donghuensis TaxID=1163398 RepID=UPI000C2A757D|nr:hypothetical protein [Pseudomonas donghuensis]PJY94486.1 hypothetical protein COO64_20940 [Pseudomonas donghuensis]WKY26061.1 hypothetical protein QYF67_14135 [Pseudomonas donghuensis]